MKSLETPLDMKNTCFSRNLKMSKPDFNFSHVACDSCGDSAKEPRDTWVSSRSTECAAVNVQRVRGLRGLQNALNSDHSPQVTEQRAGAGDKHEQRRKRWNFRRQNS